MKLTNHLPQNIFDELQVKSLEKCGITIQVLTWLGREWLHENVPDFEMVSFVRSVKEGKSSMTARGSTGREEMGLGNTRMEFFFTA